MSNDFLSHLKSRLKSRIRGAIARRRPNRPNTAPTSESFRQQAQQARDSGDLDRAAQIYHQAIDRFPNDAELHQALADLEQARDRWPEVVAALTAACDRGHDSALNYQRLGHAHCQQKQWQNAAIAYRESIRRNPDSYWAQHGLGLVSLRLKQWAEASVAFAKALGIDPDALRSRAQLCRSLANECRWRECCQTLAVAIAKYRDEFGELTDVGPWLKRFEGLDLDCPWPDDFESFSVAIETFIDAGAYLRVDGKPVDLAPVADVFFRAAIDRFPTRDWHYFFYFNRLLIRFRNQKRLEELCDLFRAAIAAEPDARDTYLNLAAVANFHDDNRTAAIAYATLLDRDAGLEVRLAAREATDSIPAADTRLSPRFFIIGVQKGGTTSLHSYLCAHPQIVSGAHKEIDFWSTEYDRGLDWYMGQFPPRCPASDDWVTGEASNTYIDHPDAPVRLHAALPEAKLVMVLRDPTERAISHYYQRYRERNLTVPIEQFLRSELEFTRANPPETITAEQYVTHLRGRSVSRGLYSTFIKRWLRHFPKSSMLAIDSREFFGNTGAVVERVQQFIGLEPQGLSEYPVFNPGSYRKISPELDAELREFFHPYNEELTTLLDFEFDWPRSVESRS